MIIPRLGYDIRKAVPADNEVGKRNATDGVSGEELPDRESDGVVTAASAVVGGDEVVSDRE